MKITDITKLFESFKDAQARFSQDEDPDIVEDYIKQFRTLAQKNVIQGSDKDVGKWIKKGWPDFRNFVDSKKEQPSKTDIKRKRVNKSDEVIVLVDNDTFTAVIPLTERASCFYGKNTNWCVSVVSEENMFHAYAARGRFPIHIFSDGESFSIVIDIESGMPVEARDSKNQEIKYKTLEDDHGVPVPDILAEFKKHIDVLGKVSKESRTANPRAAVYYANHIGERFEDGEKIIASDFHCAILYLYTVLEYKRVPIIDEAILSGLGQLETRYDTETQKNRVVSIIEKHLEQNFLTQHLPDYVNVDIIVKYFPEFYYRYVRYHKIELTVKEFVKLDSSLSQMRAAQNTADEFGIVALMEFGELDTSLDYIRMLHNLGTDVEEYVEAFFKHNTAHNRRNVVSYVTHNVYEHGFTNLLLTKMPERISVQNVYDIVSQAQKGEDIFKSISPSALSPGNMYKMIKANRAVIDVIGDIPDDVQDYMDEEGLSL